MVLVLTERGGVSSPGRTAPDESADLSFPSSSILGGPGRPTPKYTRVGERLRHVLPGHVACSVACGGRACKYENPARWTEQEQAITGLYSSW